MSAGSILSRRPMWTRFARGVALEVRPLQRRARATAWRWPLHLAESTMLTLRIHMSTVLRTIEFLCLGLWVGSDVFLSFVVARGAFRILGSRDAAGAMVGFALGRMHLLGVICGVLLLLVRLIRTRSVAGFVAPVVLCVVLMIGLTVASQVAVSPRMAILRVQMGSIEATAEGSPLLAEFGRLHRVSVLLESGVLLAGLAAFYFMVREARI
jgi:hypothetical protein